MSGWLESLKGVVTERVSNPLLFAFALSWVVFNFPVVLMVLSTAGAEYKVDYIAKQLAREDANWRLLSGPLVVAALYTVLIPWVSHLILWYSYWQSTFTRALKNKHEQAILITVKERDELVSQHQDTVDRLYAEMTKRSAYFADQTREKDELVKSIAELNRDVSEYKAKISLQEIALNGLQQKLDESKNEVDFLNGVIQTNAEGIELVRQSVPTLKKIADVETHRGSAMASAEVQKAKATLLRIIKEFGDNII